MRLDGADPRPLTFGPWNDDRPAFSPDGRLVAFVSDREGQRGIWLVGSDGGSLRKLTNAETLGALSWSRDSSRIVYAASTSDDWPGLWTVSVADGVRARLPTPGAASEPAWSPTRDLIAYMSPSTSGPSFTKLALLDVTGKAVDIVCHHLPRISARASELAHRFGLPMAGVWRSSPTTSATRRRSRSSTLMLERLTGNCWNCRPDRAFEASHGRATARR